VITLSCRIIPTHLAERHADWRAKHADLACALEHGETSVFTIPNN